MPKLGDNSTLENFNVGSFGFTAQSINDLESSSFTLVDIAVDMSSSVESFADEIETALKNVVLSLKGDMSKGIKPHPKSDSIMIRITKFSNDVTEVVGYCLLANLDTSMLTGQFKAHGMTALYDATINAAEAAYNYAKALREQTFEANWILFVITDGLNNSGRFRNDSYLPEVKKAMALPRKSEIMESTVSVLIGVNVGEAKNALEKFRTEAGFTQDMILLSDASPKTIGKIGGFISQSISSQTAARGTGGPSQSIASQI